MSVNCATRSNAASSWPPPSWSAWLICRPKSVRRPPERWLKSAAAQRLTHLEAEHIRRILNSTETMEEAAAVLGIDPSTLYRKRKRYGLCQSDSPLPAFC